MVSNILPFVLFIVFFWLISLFDCLPVKLHGKQRNFVFGCAVLLLAVFAGGRWSPWIIGVDASIFDYDAYKTIYQYPMSCLHFFRDYLNADILIRQMEIGYVFYSSLIHNTLGVGYNYYLLLTNIILIVLFIKSFKVNHIHKCLLFILYFYAARLYLQYNFILMRQAIAIAIIWYSFHYLMLQGQRRKYYFAVLLAMSFHVSAVICFIVPYLHKITIKKKPYFLILSLVFLMNVLGLSNGLILGVIEFALSLLNIDGFDRLLKYLLVNEEGTRGLNLLTFAEAIPFVYIAIVYERQMLATKEGKFYYNMLFVFLFLLVLTMNFSFLTRMCQYLMYAYFYILSFYAAHASVKNRCMMFSLLGVYLLVYSFRYIMIWFYTVPYSFFLLH